MQKIVKEYLAAHQKAIKEINTNIKNTNDRLDRISKKVADLKQSLEFRQDQMKDDFSDIKNSKN